MKALSVTLIISLITIFSPLVQAIDPSLVLCMPFEEGSGKTTKDQSGHGNDGKLMGDVKWTNGKHGEALEFNRGYVQIESDDTLQVEDGGFSIEAWIKVSPATDQWGRVVDKFYGTGYCFGRRGGDLVIGAEFNGSPNSFGSNTAVFDEKWHHVALTREVKGGTNELKIYVDGKLENIGGGGGAKQHNLDTTPVRIAAGDMCCAEGPPNEVGYFVIGVIDEVAIYKKVLTVEEIKRDMEEGIAQAVEPSGKLATTWAGIKSR